MRSGSALLFAACAFALLTGTVQAAVDKQNYGEIARGRYLATLADCAACHTAEGGKPYAGGRPIETPFGTLVAPNLTPDLATGIGAWTDDEFVNSLLAGTGKGGSHLYPAMPYTYYTRMSREDAIAIRTYLATLDPVRNVVHSNQLPFPFNVRGGIVAWNWLFFDPGPFKPDPHKSAEWNRGAYLVEGPGHCGMCHTPKNLLGGDKSSHPLAGGLLQGWFAPNLSHDTRVGLGGWSADEVVRYLKTGRNDVTLATGPMAEVVTDSTSKMSEEDLQAMATYLLDKQATARSGGESSGSSTPPTQVHGPESPPQHQPPPRGAGETLYVDNCAACHGRSGAGVPGMFPALKGSPSVQQDDPTSLLRIVLGGARAVATDPAPTAPAMPAMSWKLSDAEVASVLSYIRSAWGNSAAPVGADAVTKVRRQVAKVGP